MIGEGDVSGTGAPTQSRRCRSSRKQGACCLTVGGGWPQGGAAGAAGGALFQVDAP